jgi:uncharacterized HAD superfamily protein
MIRVAWAAFARRWLVTLGFSGMLSAMGNVHFYVDLDDVLAETTRALAEMARARFGKSVAFEEMRVFDLALSLGLDDDEYPAFMNAAHEPDFLTGLQAIPGASDTLARWRSAGIRVDVITGRPPNCREPTLQWLEARRIPFDTLEFVDKYGRYGNPAAASPEHLLRRDFRTVIEDADQTARDLALHTDALVLLYDRPWNQNSEAEAHGAVRVRSWDEVQRLTERAA